MRWCLFSVIGFVTAVADSLSRSMLCLRTRVGYDTPPARTRPRPFRLREADDGHVNRQPASYLPTSTEDGNLASGSVVPGARDCMGSETVEHDVVVPPLMESPDDRLFHVSTSLSPPSPQLYRDSARRLVVLDSPEESNRKGSSEANESTWPPEDGVEPQWSGRQCRGSMNDFSACGSETPAVSCEGEQRRAGRTAKSLAAIAPQPRPAPAAPVALPSRPAPPTAAAAASVAVASLSTATGGDNPLACRRSQPKRSLPSPTALATFAVDSAIMETTTTQTTAQYRETVNQTHKEEAGAMGEGQPGNDNTPGSSSKSSGGGASCRLLEQQDNEISGMTIGRREKVAAYKQQQKAQMDEKITGALTTAQEATEVKTGAHQATTKANDAEDEPENRQQIATVLLRWRDAVVSIRQVLKVTDRDEDIEGPDAGAVREGEWTRDVAILLDDGRVLTLSRDDAGSVQPCGKLSNGLRTWQVNGIEHRVLHLRLQLTTFQLKCWRSASARRRLLPQFRLRHERVRQPV